MPLLGSYARPRTPSNARQVNPGRTLAPGRFGLSMRGRCPPTWLHYWPRGRSSVGRASASQAEGRGFEPHRPLHCPAGLRPVSRPLRSPSCPAHAQYAWSTQRRASPSRTPRRPGRGGRRCGRSSPPTCPCNGRGRRSTGRRRAPTSRTSGACRRSAVRGIPAASSAGFHCARRKFFRSITPPRWPGNTSRRRDAAGRVSSASSALVDSGTRRRLPGGLAVRLRDAVRARPLDEHDARLPVNVAPLDRQPLGRPHARLGGEHDRGAVLRAELLGDEVDLRLRERVDLLRFRLRVRPRELRRVLRHVPPPHRGLKRLPERLHDPVARPGGKRADPRGDLGHAPLELLERQVAERRRGVAEPVRERLDRRRRPGRPRARRDSGRRAPTSVTSPRMTRPDSSGSITSR